MRVNLGEQPREHLHGHASGLHRGQDGQFIDAKEFLTANQVTAISFYVTYPDVTVKQIEKALRDEKVFQQVLDNPAAADALQDPALKPLLELAAD